MATKSVIIFKSNLSVKQIQYCWLSNFWPNVHPKAYAAALEHFPSLGDTKGAFEVDGLVYPTVEHYFQAAKYDHQPELHETLRKAKSAQEAKRLNDRYRREHPIDFQAWEKRKQHVMYKALWAKFTHNPELGDALRSTGSAILQEAGPGPWGGRAGKLGILLTRVRDALPLRTAPKNATAEECKTEDSLKS